jgi:uncharacterized membrane protein
MNDVIESKTHTEITGSTGTGTVKGNIAGILCYVGGIIAAIVLLLLEKDNKFVRFHAMQSIITIIAILVISMVVVFIPIIGLILWPIIWLLTIALFLFLAYKAYQEELFKVPVIGDFVAKQVGI